MLIVEKILFGYDVDLFELHPQSPLSEIWIMNNFVMIFIFSLVT